MLAPENDKSNGPKQQLERSFYSDTASIQFCSLMFALFMTTSNPFALSLSKGLHRGTRWLRQAQPERCVVSQFT
jgi:hypothetical protein